MTEYPAHSPEHTSSRELAALCLSALGVVYGDIGTSPLYALRECFNGPHSVAPTPGNVLGVLSLVTWSLVIVIGVKYLAYVMRADNEGEGGILALMALAQDERRRGTAGYLTIIAIGLFGSALLYGDGIITPAISVLSAVEGIEIATPAFSHYVLPITIVILVVLFWFQHKGTAGVGVVFGPLTLIWFVTLACIGVVHIVRQPSVLAAVSPSYAAAFFSQNHWHGVLVLGAVFLTVTGGEALYADMGHFGRRPIRLMWFALVMPALLLNYFGQGALLLRNPSAASNPFYSTVPTWGLYPMVVLATIATIIASQAVISGAFSLSRQAIMLGFLPRLRTEHTSSKQIGQIYVPFINWALAAATIVLVLGFKNSSNLAAAYGIAVTTTMVITTLLAYVVARRLWGWSLGAALGVTVPFLIIDVLYFGANVFKIADGGWVPLVVAGAIFVLMTTWRRGRELLAERLREKSLEWEKFLELVAKEQPVRVKGTAVFMTGSSQGAPTALVHNLVHNHVLHEQVVFVTIVTEPVARVRANRRVAIEHLEEGFVRVIGHYGFKQSPNVPYLLRKAESEGLHFDPEHLSFFLGRETILASDRPGMALWREKIFAVMSQNAQRATAFFHIPPDRVVELGTQIEL
jgi:KUP system potassium uptake protein